MCPTALASALGRRALMVPLAPDHPPRWPWSVGPPGTPPVWAGGIESTIRAGHRVRHPATTLMSHLSGRMIQPNRSPLDGSPNDRHHAPRGCPRKLLKLDRQVPQAGRYGTWDTACAMGRGWAGDAQLRYGPWCQTGRLAVSGRVLRRNEQQFDRWDVACRRMRVIGEGWLFATMGRCADRRGRFIGEEDRTHAHDHAAMSG